MCASREVIGIIPARYGSTRLEGKLMLNILGKPIIQYTFEAAKKSQLLKKIIVATDDKRISEVITRIGGNTIMTSTECRTGTDRIIEALEKLTKVKYDAVVNIQGDEPLVNPEHIDAAVEALLSSPDAVVGTVVYPIKNESEYYNRNAVKCVFDVNKYAMYFSRAPIPHSKSGNYNPNTPCYRHIGIYAYRPDFLIQYGKLDFSSLEQSEELEQLRVLQNGYRIKVSVVGEAYPGVDCKSDFEYIESIIFQKQHQQV